MPSLSPSELDRRKALQLLAASMAAGVTGCSRPEEDIIPYANMPEGLVAGEPLRFATSFTLAGYGRGFLGISVDGRPIKIEGNPRHPYSLGATDVFAEAEVISLYDPDRSKIVRHGDDISTWDDFTAAWAGVKTDARVALVTGRIVSPTTLSAIQALNARYPQLSWYRYEPVNDDASRAGSRLAYGRVLDAIPDWASADSILCLDADPLGPGPEQLHIARNFSARRRPPSRQRLTVVEPAWSLTGAAADTRLPLRPELVGEVARIIARKLGATVGEPALPSDARAFADRAADALMAARGRAFVLAGAGQSPELHALCHWINGALNAPIKYLDPVDSVERDHGASLTALAKDLAKQQCDALVILEANPVYDAPDSFEIAKAISKVPLSVRIGLRHDETSAVTRWHLPLSHPLESWGDTRAVDGTAALVQPLIRPLYDTRTADEILALLAGAPVKKAYDLVQAQWRHSASGDFESWWRGALEQGVASDSAAQAVSAPSARAPFLPTPVKPAGLTLVLSLHPTLWDGRFANNPWLQECPQPFTKEVWGNAIQISPEDAERFAIADTDAARLDVEGQIIETRASMMPGQVPGIIAASWGAGRTHAGRIGNGIGKRYSGLGRVPFARTVRVARLSPGSDITPLRSTQNHTRLAGRTEELFPIARLVDLAKQNAESEPPPTLLPEPKRGEYAWAMVVDADACIGCNACVVACQAENNVPIVGPEEISLGRDMHWLRVDSYGRPEASHQRQGFQPVPCMHCELAPCEPVCPVEASVHDHQGLNVQVYNRCIGTRFCEANCPYKVRRFNWFAYAGEQAYGDESAALKAQHNPDVSARGRGVMEKCNYCLQRISRARRTAEKQNRHVAEGEMVTACQAACPTHAIHFGDLTNPGSEVSRLRRDPRHYTLLEELNTKPRTTYLKRLYADEDDQ
jgi:molybdopterin-containing oxidoreductase family iron-sulfur binding subunit